MPRTYGRKRQNPAVKVMGTRGFGGGLQQLSHPSALKNNELTEARNVRYRANGLIEKRSGSLTLGSSAGARINALYSVYNIGDDDEDYFFRINNAGLLQYYNFNTSVWSGISGSPTFSDTYTNILQAYGNVYFLNDTDEMVKWDGNSWTTFTAIANPSSPPSASKTGSADNDVTYYYRYVWYNNVGNTIASTADSVSDCPNAFDSDTYVTVNVPSAPTGAVWTGIFRGVIAGDEEFLARIPADQLTYTDNGTDTPNSLFGVPENNTTGGFKFRYAEVYRSTIIGVTVEEGPDTLVFSGGADKIDSFGRADGGGFYAWRKDDGEGITGIQSFTLSNEDGLYVTKRSKIGVFTFDESGGSVRDINVGVGIVSHLSLHAAGNNLRGWGEDGAVSIQNEANFANIIRTQVFSIKADLVAKSVTYSDISKIAGEYYDGLSLFALPTGEEGAGNSTVLVYDERFTAWSEWRGLAASIWATNIGPDNKRKLYFGSSQEGKVVEMFRGKTDDGSPVTLRVTTKQWDADKPYAFKKYRRIIYIFGNITGLETSITQLEDGVRAQLPLVVVADQGNTGFGVDRWGEQRFGETSGTYEPDTSGLVIRYGDLSNKDLFSIQSTIENSGLADDIQIVGLYIMYSDSNRPLKSSQKLLRSA